MFSRVMITRDDEAPEQPSSRSTVGVVRNDFSICANRSGTDVMTATPGFSVDDGTCFGSGVGVGDGGGGALGGGAALSMPSAVNFAAARMVTSFSSVRYLSLRMRTRYVP